ncbi:Adenylate and Guanylate cyclase catalytic domain containing protein [Tritrichomonas foetus]|uniref:Adenylate and Guanylate cyclase catalytic domain containing protein n=1 Tax=Tritrichomonas foetus TaxID=1144522 RepID=A0A1J4KQA4_9EUKA|nr:Adenylate and Guanylate cyclase catalytic domain containing protein [Tritrichomonas foetus]|eukprot:OHT13088.1 Adenylate and Guanylate cyclase catalytic domain containing protein [Tritrichomonas foetus]
MVLYIEISFILAYFIIIIIITFIEMRMLANDKNIVFKCLSSLPKNVVSQVAEGLRILKKDDMSDDGKDDTSRGLVNDSNSGEIVEVNKQEDNILKIFSTWSDNSSFRLGAVIIFVFLNILIYIICVVNIVLICNLYKEEIKMFKKVAPHLDNIPGAYAYFTASIIALNNICFTMSGETRIFKNTNTLVSRLNARMLKSEEYFNYAMYGKEGEDEYPFEKINEGIETHENASICADENAVPTNKVQMIECFTAEYQVVLMKARLQMIMRKHDLDRSVVISTRDDTVLILWYYGVVSLYNTFYYPMFEGIVDDMRVRLDSEITDSLPAIILCLILSICAVLATIFHAKRNEVCMHYVLKLLLSVPINAVITNNKIMAVIGGDFRDHSLDTANRDNEFYKQVVESLPDCVCVISKEGNIVLQANSAFVRIFGEDLLNTDLTLFEPLKPLFSSDNRTMNMEYQSMHFIVSLIAHHKYSIVTARDQTLMVKHNQLLKEEKAVSDRLLSSILPPNLVRRVQAGESNISFAVQTATILFLDIVEFTPWCASNSASTVMSTLNNFFKRLDAMLATHSTMTKVKCIGDCYMAAGGIFAEVNQPNTHAKEVCEFGLEAIEQLIELNEELSQTLRIRVGINTGGPIVAGVLGVGKPTFEILGPTINMAQQMEHHGVPMKVHISRSTYELIYGGSFDVKERGEIEVKNGKVSTYLINPPNIN